MTRWGLIFVLASALAACTTTGPVANSAAIVKAWNNLGAGLQRESTRIGYPVYANRAPGSSRLPFGINLPPYNYFPEIN